MEAIKLYKLLQQHVSTMNRLTLALYNEERKADEVLPAAQAEVKKMTKELDGE